MKVTSNTIGMLIFAALATVVFVLMAMRPTIEGNAINWGVPLPSETVEATETTENKTTEEAKSTSETETSSSTEQPKTEDSAPADETNSESENSTTTN